MPRILAYVVEPGLDGFDSTNYCFAEGDEAGEAAELERVQARIDTVLDSMDVDGDMLTVCLTEAECRDCEAKDCALRVELTAVGRLHLGVIEQKAKEALGDLCAGSAPSAVKP